MKRKTIFASALAAAGMLTVSSALAALITVTFDLDPDGLKADGFASVDSGLVTFSKTPVVSYLETGFAGIAETNGTNALGVFADDDSQLEMNFSVVANSLSLDFGNDDLGTIDNPGPLTSGDHATLTLYMGLAQVGQAFTVINGDNFMNQSVSISGIEFNRATFGFTDPDGGLRSATEIVDNIQFNVPEPGSLALLCLGLAGLGFGRRKKA